ncbi:LexA family protein [Marinilactibacillus psychrotolerans]|uniref:LexA family protein n=1 Tax=Marinilactibacillus psychrotolerans TaxID=191770 RepID=UPI003886E130
MEDISKHIGLKIKYYRKEKKMTQTELGEKIGTKKATISNYETGYRAPSQDTLFELADVLEISIDDLFPPTERESIASIYNQLEKPRQQKVYSYAEHQLEEQNKKVLYDIQGQVAAGPAIEYGDPQVESQYVEYVPASADMALTINGDSMEPDFPNGSIVFYKRQPDIENGEIAIVEINKEAVTCKKVIFDYDNKKIVLRSLNKKYDDMIYDDEQIRILGKVVK